MRSHPWPKALRVIYETDPIAREVEVYSLGCHGAYCNACDWKSKLVTTSEEALQERARHLDEVGGQAWHQLHEKDVRRKREQAEKDAARAERATKRKTS